MAYTALLAGAQSESAQEMARFTLGATLRKTAGLAKQPIEELPPMSGDNPMPRRTKSLRAAWERRNATVFDLKKDAPESFVDMLKNETESQGH